jgi:hypothetical protein
MTDNYTAAIQTHGKVVRYRTENADRHFLLELPDGRLTEKLRQPELYRELARLRVPGVASAMSKAALMDAYAALLMEIRDETLPPTQIRERVLSRTHMRAAAQFLAERRQTQVNERMHR